jgi:hypothetical protein
MAEEGFGNAVFFVFFTIYGMFGLSMLILATLISKFDCGTRDDFKLANVLPLNALIEEVKRGVQAMRTGGKKAQMRKARDLAEKIRRGLLDEDGNEKKEGTGGPELGPDGKPLTPEEERAKRKRDKEEEEAKAAK